MLVLFFSVFETLGGSTGPFVVCYVIPWLFVACFVRKIFTIDSQSCLKITKSRQFVGGRTQKNFMPVCWCDYSLLFGKVWLGSICWPPCAKAANGYKPTQLSTVWQEYVLEPVVKIVTLQLSHVALKHIDIFLCNGPLCSNLQYISYATYKDSYNDKVPQTTDHSYQINNLLSECKNMKNVSKYSPKYY